MLRTAARLLPLHRAFDAGLRPGPFPDRAASLLPGLLAATRTGLTPAGDDELMSDHDSFIDLQRWAHSEEPCKRGRKDKPCPRELTAGSIKKMLSARSEATPVR